MSTNHVEAGVSQPAAQDRGRLLRRSLQLDAVASGAVGVLLEAAGPALDDLLGIPVLGFTTREKLRQALGQRSHGRLQLDPGDTR